MKIYDLLSLSVTYELVPDPVPVLDEGSGDDQTVDEREKHGPALRRC